MTVMTMAERGGGSNGQVFGWIFLGTTDHIIDDPNGIMCLPTCN